MQISDIVSIVATAISLSALLIAIIPHISAMPRLNVSIKMFGYYDFQLTVSNMSSKSICLVNLVFYQDDKVVRITSSNRLVIEYLPLEPTYLSPYQAITMHAKSDIKILDTNRPITLAIETTRKCIFYSLDLSNHNNPVIYKHRHYRKRNAHNR